MKCDISSEGSISLIKDVSTVPFKMSSVKSPPPLQSHFTLNPVSSTKSCNTEYTKSIVSLNTSKTVVNDDTMDSKPVVNGDVSKGDNVSNYSDNKMLPSEEIPKQDSKLSNTSNVSLTKRKLEASQSTSNKITCSNGNARNNDNPSRFRVVNNRFDPCMNRNHCQGQLSYRERLDQHACDNYDSEPRNPHGRHHDRMYQEEKQPHDIQH